MAICAGGVAPRVAYVRGMGVYFANTGRDMRCALVCVVLWGATFRRNRCGMGWRGPVGRGRVTGGRGGGGCGGPFSPPTHFGKTCARPSRTCPAEIRAVRLRAAQMRSTLGPSRPWSEAMRPEPAPRQRGFFYFLQLPRAGTCFHPSHREAARPFGNLGAWQSDNLRPCSPISRSSILTIHL